jgi:hypothetical protein
MRPCRREYATPGPRAQGDEETAVATIARSQEQAFNSTQRERLRYLASPASGYADRVRAARAGVLPDAHMTTFPLRRSGA